MSLRSPPGSNSVSLRILRFLATLGAPHVPDISGRIRAELVVDLFNDDPLVRRMQRWHPEGKVSEMGALRDAS